MSESRFLKLVIVALLLLNMGTLGFLWLGQRPSGHDGRPDGPRPPRGDAAALIRHELELSDAQESKYKVMRDSHHETVMQIRQSMRGFEKELYRLQAQPDQVGARAQENAWLDSLAGAQRRIEQITYDHFRELRAICSPEQQQRFDAIIGEALDRL